MITIWEYPLDMDSTRLMYAWRPLYDIQMPAGAQFLSVRTQIRTQRKIPYMWFLVDTDVTGIETRQFIIAGTGKKIDSSLSNQIKFLGTFFLDEGQFVGHVFEVLSE